MSVEYRDVPGFPGLQAGTDGSLKCLARKGKLGTALKERIVFGSLDSNGYKHMRFINRHLSVHRAVALAFHPNPEGRKEVNHINGIITDNRPENLEWVHPRENSRHAITNGLWGKKLDRKIIDRVLALRASGLKLREIAEVLEIRQTTIRHICERYGNQSPA